jgi:GH24 family phage-related lysozyme (muramidase)
MMNFTAPKGTTFHAVAASLGIAESLIREVNPDSGNEPVEGQTITIPVREAFLENTGFDYKDMAVEKMARERRVANKGYDLSDYMRDDTSDVTRGEFPLTTGGLKKLTAEEEMRVPSAEFLHHLRSREGSKNVVYLDSVGKPTVGVGHLLTDEDNLKEGDEISDEQIGEYLRTDASKAWNAAVEQGEELGRTDKKFVEGLASVNYQLGTGWNKIHKNTWALMRAGKWEEAADEAANSTWNEQTPVRVADFQKVLRGSE